MCGIVGLLLKKPRWARRLGELMVPMLIGMTERGPDSAGLAVFGEPLKTTRASSACSRATARPDWKRLARDARPALRRRASARTTPAGMPC